MARLAAGPPGRGARPAAGPARRRPPPRRARRRDGARQAAHAPAPGPRQPAGGEHPVHGPRLRPGGGLARRDRRSGPTGRLSPARGGKAVRLGAGPRPAAGDVRARPPALPRRPRPALAVARSCRGAREAPARGPRARPAVRAGAGRARGRPGRARPGARRRGSRPAGGRDLRASRRIVIHRQPPAAAGDRRRHEWLRADTPFPPVPLPGAGRPDTIAGTDRRAGRPVLPAIRAHTGRLRPCHASNTVSPSSRSRSC